jgi:hypothetical protein
MKKTRSRKSRDTFPLNQCCGSVTFWYGSGSADQYHSLTDPEPAFSTVVDKMSTKLSLCHSFIAYYFLNVHLYQSSKIKPKRSHQKVEIQVFLTFFAY